MAGIIEDMQKVFDVALFQFCSDNNIGCALENSGWKSDVKDPFLEGYFMPAPTEQADLFWTERRPGIYQVNINYRQLSGSSPINQMVDKLNLAFKAGSAFHRNDICVHVLSVDVGPLLIENGWAKRPVSVNFVSYTERL